MRGGVCVVACWILSSALGVAAVYNESIFTELYPRPWFAVDRPDIPSLASNGLILRQNTVTPRDFAQNVVLGIANQRRNDVRGVAR